MSNYITSNFSNLIFSCSVPSQWHMEHRVPDHCVVFVRQGKITKASISVFLKTY